MFFVHIGEGHDMESDTFARLEDSQYNAEPEKQTLTSLH